MTGTKEGAIKGHMTRMKRYGGKALRAKLDVVNAFKDSKLASEAGKMGATKRWGKYKDDVATGLYTPAINEDYLPSIKELVLLRRYPDEQLANEMLVRRRYGSICPRCGREGEFKQVYVYGSPKGALFAHTGCSHTMSCAQGTIFAKSKVPLLTWYSMLYDILITDGTIQVSQLVALYELDKATIGRMKGKLIGYLGLDGEERTFSRPDIKEVE